MEWYNTLEQKIVPIAFKAAKVVSPKVKYAQVEFENGSIAIVISFHERLDPSKWEAIENSVRLSLTRIVADPARLKIRLRYEFRSMFTRHLEGTRQAPNVFGQLHDILQFPIPASAIAGLRHVYDLLLRQSDGCDYVATTSLGGIPALTFLVRRLEDEDRPGDQNEWADFYNALRAKFHLFPGLNWSGTDAEKDRFFGWIAGLPSEANVLLFDTGTSGNGIREMVNLIRDRIATAGRFGPQQITAIGVVDGDDSAQSEVEEELTTSRGGTIHLTLTFEHVPKMLTEDCQQLIGYASARRQMMLTPLRSNAVMQITNDDGELLYSCGALVADSLLRSIIEMRRSDDCHDRGITDFMRQVISFAVAYFSIGKEYTMLQNAYEFGLINERQAVGIKERMQPKYAENVISCKSPEWDFDEKEIRRDDPSDAP